MELSCYVAVATTVFFCRNKGKKLWKLSKYKVLSATDLPFAYEFLWKTNKDQTVWFAKEGKYLDKRFLQ